MARAPVALRKLGPQHVEALAALWVAGMSYEQMQARLARGIRHGGVALPSVQVEPRTIRSAIHSQEGREAARRAKAELFGDVYESELAWAGERLRRIESLYVEAEAEHRMAEDAETKKKWATEMRQLLAAARQEEADVQNRKARGTIKLKKTDKEQGTEAELGWDGDPEYLARHLSALQEVGLVPASVGKSPVEPEPVRCEAVEADPEGEQHDSTDGEGASPSE